LKTSNPKGVKDCWDELPDPTEKVEKVALSLQSINHNQKHEIELDRERRLKLKEREKDAQSSVPVAQLGHRRTGKPLQPSPAGSSVSSASISPPPPTESPTQNTPSTSFPPATTVIEPPVSVVPSRSPSLSSPSSSRSASPARPEEEIPAIPGARSKLKKQPPLRRVASPDHLAQEDFQAMEKFFAERKVSPSFQAIFDEFCATPSEGDLTYEMVTRFRSQRAKDGDEEEQVVP